MGVFTDEISGTPVPSSDGAGEAFRVDPEALLAAAGEADSIGEQIASCAGMLGANADVLTAAHSGWASAAALRSCTDVWQANLQKAGAQVIGVGGKLRDTVRAYADADGRSGQHFESFGFGGGR